MAFPESRARHLLGRGCWPAVAESVIGLVGAQEVTSSSKTRPTRPVTATALSLEMHWQLPGRCLNAMRLQTLCSQQDGSRWVCWMPSPNLHCIPDWNRPRKTPIRTRTSHALAAQGCATYLGSVSAIAPIHRAPASRPLPLHSHGSKTLFVCNGQRARTWCRDTNRPHNRNTLVEVEPRFPNSFIQVSS
jgi:hypothetical protein